MTLLVSTEIQRKDLAFQTKMKIILLCLENNLPTFLQETINFKIIAFLSSSCVVNSIKEH